MTSNREAEIMNRAARRLEDPYQGLNPGESFLLYQAAAGTVAATLPATLAVFRSLEKKGLVKSGNKGYRATDAGMLLVNGPEE